MRINHGNLSSLNEFEKIPMSSLGDKGVKIYRSNPEITRKYFGNRDYDPCVFELVVLNYKYGEPEIFLQLPYADCYIELVKHGEGSRGMMSRASLGNPIGDLINGFYFDGKLSPEKFTLYTTDENAMIDLGVSDFIFLEKVAERINPLHGRSLDNVEGSGIILDEMTAKYYAKIPDLRRVAYHCISQNDDEIIVDQSAHNFTYEGMRAWYRKGYQNTFTEVKIENFVRYRDGGTTLFNFEYHGNHESFYPSRLGESDRKAMLDEIILNDMHSDVTRSLCDTLGIMLEPLYEKAKI